MTKRSKFNKYARRCAAAGRPLSRVEVFLSRRRQTQDPPTGKRHKHRVTRTGKAPDHNRAR